MRGGVKTAFFEMHCSTSFDVTHGVADLVERVMDSYKGPFSFSKIKEVSTPVSAQEVSTPVSAQEVSTPVSAHNSSSVAYAGVVDVIIVRNPNKAVRGKSAYCKNRKSYVSITISSPDQNALQCLESYIAKNVPAIGRRIHKISAYNNNAGHIVKKAQ